MRYSAVVRRKVGGFTGSVVDSFSPERVAEDKERMIENATPGVVKNGVEAYNYDETDKLVDLKAIYFVPETPLFNCYIVDIIGKLYDNVGNVPKLSYSIFLPAVAESVLTSI